MRPYAPNDYFKTAGLKRELVMAKPVRVFTVFGYNTGGAQWLHIFDATEAPATGTQPLFSITIAAAREFYFETVTGIPLKNGLVAAISSTAETFTAAVAEDCLIAVTKL